MIAIRFKHNEEQRLDALAKRTGRTKTFYVREAVETYLDDIEDYYLAKKISAKIDSGEMKTYSLEEVEKELGL
jgi:RHH-type rel operon transcriptional repressor/antitoxin RelB